MRQYDSDPDCRAAMRNALAHAGKSGRRVVSAFIATAFAQETPEAASQQWRSVADQVRAKVLKLATLMDEAETDVLAYMTFPKEHRAKIYSNNLIERLNGEIKRRTNLGGIFPNEAAITRLIGAILLEQNDEWAVQRARHMTLETMAPLSDNPNVMLSAVPGSRPTPATLQIAVASLAKLHHAMGHDPLRIEVAEPKLILKAKMDCRNSTGNFTCNEGLASDGTFMIEQDAIRREYTVSFAIVYRDPVGAPLCRSVGRARIKRRALALGNFLNKTIELRRLRLIKTRLVRQT